MLRFTDYGYLPPGDHELTFSQLRESILVHGEPWITGWNEAWRRQLVDNLELLVRQLWQVGVFNIYLDGSFCSTKPEPADIDAYYDLPLPEEVLQMKEGKEKFESVLLYILALSEQLNQFNEIPIWNIWDKMQIDEMGYKRTEMWMHYRCDIFPHCWGMYAGDVNGRKVKFDEFFRKDKYGIEKGVIKLVKG